MEQIEDSKRSRYIECTKGARDRLAVLFNVTDKTVYRALQYEGADSEIRRKIRHVATKELGGIEMVRQPVVETIWDSNGAMHQYFPNHWLIEIDKKTGQCLVFDKGGNVRQVQPHCTIEELAHIQDFVISQK